MPNLGTARAQRFHAYVERLSTALGHRDRYGPLRAYVTGLCLPGERKSIEPMAARVDPRHVRARHQSMHHFVANAAWDDGAVLRAARETVLAALERHGPVAAWVVDDTGMPKKGRHSVGVARQYYGVLGKQDNCQVAVSISLAHERASVPVAYRLYLPEMWAQDRRRRPAADAGPPHRTASPTQRTGPGPATAGAGLAHRDLAPRHPGRDAFALCGGPRAARAPRRLAFDAAPRGVVAYRVAAPRSRPDQVLAVHAAAHGDARRSGPARDAALAHRAGLPRAEGRAGARSF